MNRYPNGAEELPGSREPDLAAVHADPTASWSVAAMAKHAGMSRSVFFERFREVVGEAPTAYLTRWRIEEAIRS